MLAFAVTFSILALAVGPTLLALGSGRGPAVHAIVDGFVLGLVPALIALRILPHLYAQLGSSAVAFLALGFIGLSIVSHSSGRLRVATSLTVGTFAVHSLVDGASLAVATRGGGAHALPLTLGLVSHRIPEGLLLGTLLLPRFGSRGTAAATMLVAALTAIGAISGERLLAHADSHLLHAMIALGMGAMLRVAFHRHSSLFHKRDFALGALGLLFGAILAIVLPVTKDVESTASTVRTEP